MNTIPLTCSPKPLMIAHRGCSKLERENTVAAFVAAGNRSYFGIETDVHKTVDGHYILIHDDSTKRVALDNLIVEQSTYGTLRRLTLLNRETEEKDRADLCLPSLEEYISVCRRYEKTAVLELKNAFQEADIYEICAIIAEAGYLENVIFISFNYQNLVYLRRKYPHQPAQFLVSDFKDDLIDRLLEHRLDLDIDFHALTPERVQLCHDHGIRVNTWTVDTVEDAERLAAMGVDFITSNIIE